MPIKGPSGEKGKAPPQGEDHKDSSSNGGAALVVGLVALLILLRKR